MFNKYIGTRDFYRSVLTIAIPIIIQNGITNFVSMLDNVMVGQIGTVQMNGVTIVNGLLFVFNLCIFGASSGAGIFTAQFHGTGDQVGIRHTFRFKTLACLGLTAIGLLIFSLGWEPLIGLYLTGQGDPQIAADSLRYGKDYLFVMLLGLPAFAMSNVYSSTLRETGQTVVPMVGGITAVLVNLVLNYILIYGHLGLPALGVVGAAIATVTSRYVELIIISLWTHRNHLRNPFIEGVYDSLQIPGSLFVSIMKKGMPLLVNEFLWSAGMATLNQCYSTCGLDVVPAMNISSVFYNLGSVVYLSMGNSVGIIMGRLLGASTPEAEVRDTNRKLIALSIASGLLFGVLMAAFSGLFPKLYNTDASVQALATQLICVGAFMLAFNSYTNAAYFTLRSGGQTIVTFLFDSCFVWGFCVPLAFCLSRFTDMPILPLYMICQATDFIKCIIGAWMIKKGAWIQNLVAKKA